MWRKKTAGSPQPSAARADTLDVDSLQRDLVDFNFDGEGEGDGRSGGLPAGPALPARPASHGSKSAGKLSRPRAKSKTARARYESSVRQAVESHSAAAAAAAANVGPSDKQHSRYESSVRRAVGEAARTDGSSSRAGFDRAGRDVNHVRAHRGWLEKQGGIRKNWKRRFFTFHPQSLTLSYFEDAECTKKKGQFRVVPSRKQPRNSSADGSSLSATVAYDDAVEETKEFTVFCEGGRELCCRATSAAEAVTWCAVLDNEFFFTRLRREVDQRVAVLQQGHTFQKHGRMGKPHDRYVWLSKDETRVCWAKPEVVSAASASGRMKRLIKKDQVVYIENVRAIERGRKTAVFQRWSGKSGKSAAEPTGSQRSTLDLRCFSLVTEGRSLDLVAEDQGMAEAWIEALSYLWLFAHSMRERATRTGRWQSWQAPKYAADPVSGSNEGKITPAVGANAAAAEARHKLEHRGAQIEQLQSQSAALEDSASSFEEMCHQLAKRERQKARGGWFGF